MEYTDYSFIIGGSDIETDYDEFTSDIRHQNLGQYYKNWQIIFRSRKGNTVASHVVKHWHREMEWIVPVRGNAECWINDRYYLVRPGEMIVIPSLLVHESRREDFHEPYEGYVIHVSDEYLRSLIPEYDVLEYEPMAPGRERIYDLLAEIITLLHSREPFIRLQIQCRMDEILCLLTKQAEVREGKPITADQKDLVLAVMKELDRRAFEPLSLTEIAACQHVSYGHLSRLFKQATGISMTAYAADLRMNKAREKIERTDLPLDEISRACGYESYSSFAKKFKARFGEPPSAIRKNRS